MLFSQYPQYSCTTSGSSLNEAAHILKSRDTKNMRFSVIDRFYHHKAYLMAYAQNLLITLGLFPENVRRDVPVVFTAHSVPLSVVERGDAYKREVEETVESVVKTCVLNNQYYLGWQSRVGFMPWVGPNIDDLVAELIKSGKARHGLLLAPVSFTSDHVETSYDLKSRSQPLVNSQFGYTKLVRLPAFNGQPVFADVFELL